MLTVTTAGRTFEATETVAKADEKGGTYTVTIDRSAGAGKLPARVHAVSPGGLSWNAEQDAKVFDPVPAIKPGVKAGDTWTAEKTAAGKYSFTMGKEEEVEVPAGKYKAVRVDFVTTNGMREVKTSAWYAAGVGPVKQVSEEGGATSTLELKSFTPGKDEKKDK